MSAIVLAALSFRTPVTSVGALLPEIRRGFGMSAGVAGLLTASPVICFSAFGFLGAAATRWLGPDRALVAGVSILAAGLAARALAGSSAMFLVLSICALSGAALGNVLLPTVVITHFPRRVGSLTAAFTTALAVGASLAVGTSVPIAEKVPGQGWRLGLAVWAALAALALIPWAAVFLWRRRRLTAAEVTTQADQLRREFRVLSLARERLGWAMAVYFGAQSLQAYVALGWFVLFFRDAGMTAGRAGAVVAFLAAMPIPASLVVPSLVGRLRSPRTVIVALWLLTLIGYIGMIVAPVGGAWIWAFCVGAGGGAFSLSLTLVGRYGKSTAATAQLSTFTQGTGYLIAGIGPLAVGLSYGATLSWTWPFVILFCAQGVQLAAGLQLGEDLAPIS